MAQNDDDSLAPPSFADRKREEAEMDMNPMVDVVFQLLIFFMVTAAFAMEKALMIPAPKPDESSAAAQPMEDSEDETVTVVVDEFNSYVVSAADWEVEAPSEQEMRRKLREARAGDSQGRVPTKLLVKANGESLHEKVVAALDAGASAGYEKVQYMPVEGDE